jgi:hypothetical protein
VKFIALLIPLITFAVAWYAKYRFHIQFALLVRKAYKYLRSDNDRDNSARAPGNR